MSSVEKYLRRKSFDKYLGSTFALNSSFADFFKGFIRAPSMAFLSSSVSHRKYTHGDDPKDIDWLVYAKTDKYYVKKFEAETNITGYLMMESE